MKNVFPICILLSVCLSVLTSCSSGSINDISPSPEITVDSKQTPVHEWSCGKTENGVFVSEFSNIKITPVNAKWTFASESEILALANIATDSDILTDELKKTAEMLKNTTVYDCLLTKDTGSNLLVMYENLALSLGVDIDAEYYVSTLKQQFNSFDLGNAGKISRAEIAGHEFIRLDCTAEYSGLKMAQVYLAEKVGNMMLVLILTDVSENSSDIDTMLSMISAVS